MKVAVVSNFYPPEAQGGAELFARDLNVELGERGLEVDVYTSTRVSQRKEQDGSVTVRFFRTNPPIPRFGSDLLGYNINPWARALVKSLLGTRYDVIHVHNINSTVMLYPLLSALRKNVVCTVHDHWPVY